MLERRVSCRASYARENRNGATQQTLFSGPRLARVPTLDTRLLGLGSPSPGPFFWPGVVIEDGARVVRKAAIYEYNSPSIRNRKSLGAREVLRLFVIAITAPIICSYRITIRTPAFCGGDNEVQLSNQFERVYADSRLRTPIGGQCCRRAN